MTLQNQIEPHQERIAGFPPLFISGEIRGFLLGEESPRERRDRWSPWAVQSSPERRGARSGRVQDRDMDRRLEPQAGERIGRRSQD